MSFPVPFCQYLAKDSPIHRIDPRIKIVLIFAYFVTLFASSSWIGLSFCAALLVGSYLLAKLPLRYMFRGLRPILYILVFTLLFNTFTFQAQDLLEQGNSDVLPLIASFGLSGSGFVKGLFFSLRILFLTSMASLLSYTTTMVNLAYAVSSLLKPFKRFGLAVDDISIIFTIALRFIPLTVEEAERIKMAQMARGVDFEEGGPIKKAKAWIPVITPLFVNLFKRADDLAAAMETRCYTSEGRSSARSMQLRTSDIVLCILGTVCLIALGLLF